MAVTAVVIVVDVQALHPTTQHADGITGILTNDARMASIHQAGEIFAVIQFVEELCILMGI